jgi:lipopolysaccharide export system protein LptA
MRRLKAILMAAGFLAMGHFGIQPSLAQAQPEANVNISADEMEVFDTEHQTMFRGNVVANQSGQQIQADQMTVTNVDVKQDDGSTKSTPDLLDARGDASIYHVRSNTMTVTGNVTLVQGKNVIKGQKLDLDMKTNHMQMTGGRVQGSFVPK